MLIIEAEQLTESSKDGQHWYIEGGVRPVGSGEQESSDLQGIDP